MPRYNYLPGDMPEATVFWAGTNNGNGDGEISLVANSAGAGFTEVGRVFEHLSLAGIYPGVFVGGTLITDANSPDEGVVPDTINDGLIIVFKLY